MSILVSKCLTFRCKFEIHAIEPCVIAFKDWNQEVVLSGELRWAAFGETEDQEIMLEGYHVFAIATRSDWGTTALNGIGIKNKIKRALKKTK